MKRIEQIVLTILTVSILTSCNFVSNLFKYRETTKELVNNILKKDYDNAVKLFALEHPSFAGTSVDTLKAKLPSMRDILVKNCLYLIAEILLSQAIWPFSPSSMFWVTQYSPLND